MPNYKARLSKYLACQSELNTNTLAFHAFMKDIIHTYRSAHRILSAQLKHDSLI